MASYSMPASAALALLIALDGNDVSACVGGGWSVDALLGEQTRPHSDLDLWIRASDTEALFITFAQQGIDRICPWPGDRPWNFVLHDAHARRVDLHFYERLDAERLHYGSAAAPFIFTEPDLSGQGSIAGVAVRCESPQFALQCHTGYQPREIDRRDVAALCKQFDLRLPDPYQQT
jgi:lincosamide nucleotidyltransferase A/C/D/E